MQLKGGKAGEEVQLSTQLTMVSLFSIDGGNLYIQEKVSDDKKKVPPMLRVQVANFRMLNSTFYKGGKEVLVFDKPNGKLVGRFTLNGGFEEYVVEVFPNRKETGLKYEMLAFDASREKFPGGARRVFNLSAHPVKGELGRLPFTVGNVNNRKFRIGSMKSTIVMPLSSDLKENESQPVVMDYYSGGKWTNFISSRWFHETNKRQYVFLYTTTKRNAVVIKSISERLNK